MTVKELRKLLKTFPKDAEVLINVRGYQSRATGIDWLVADRTYRIEIK